MTLTETTKLLSAVPKTTGMGEEMIVMGVRKTFENKRGVALVDQRSALPTESIEIVSRE